MTEPFVGSEMGEELEGTEELSRETLELNEMTNEPGTYIESKIDVTQSEVIESRFNDLVNTAIEQPQGGENEGSGLPIPIPVPMPLDGDEAELSTAEPAENLAEVLQIPMFKEGSESAGTGAATVEFNVAGEDSATYDGNTVSLIPENDAESPQGINPDPIFSESAAEDSSPDLIGENG